MPFKMHKKYIFFSEKKYVYLPFIDFQTRYPKHTCLFIWPKFRLFTFQLYIFDESAVFNQTLHGRVAIRLYMGELQSDFTRESLTQFGPMEFSIKLHVYTIEAGWSIAYIEGSQVIISKNIVFLSLKIDFV